MAKLYSLLSSIRWIYNLTLKEYSRLLDKKSNCNMINLQTEKFKLIYKYKM